MNLQYIVADTVDILGPALNKTVGQALHVLELTFPHFTVFAIMVTKHSSPWNALLGDDLRKFGQNRLGVPGRSLTIELITSENDEIWLLRIDCSRDERVREVIRVSAWVDDGILANSGADRIVEVGNLHDSEVPVPREVQRLGTWRCYQQ